MDTLGIAFGRNTHILLWFDGEGEEIQWHEEEIPAGGPRGVAIVVEKNPNCMVVVGNRVWGIPFIRAVVARFSDGLSVRYIPRPGKKGAKGKMKVFLKAVMQSGAPGRDFFAERKPLSEKPQDPAVLHPWYALTQDYLRATEEVRRAKHLVLTSMAMCFSEAVRPSREEIKKGKPMATPLPPDLWTKKMRVVLETPNPFSLENNRDVPPEVRVLARDSNGRYITFEERARYSQLHEEHLRNYKMWAQTKEDTLQRLKDMVGNHPLALAAPDSDSAVVLAGLIGWRRWGAHERDELIKFAGLNVSRVDEKGKRRISKVRPEVRNYVFLFMFKTKLGKKILALRPNKKTKVKRLDWTLRVIRARYLNIEPPSSNQAAEAA